jgi:hypothetical protein
MPSGYSTLSLQVAVGNTSSYMSNYTYLMIGLPFLVRSLGNVIGTATSYGLDGRGVGGRIPVQTKFVSSPSRPGRFWEPPSLLSNGYLGLFLREQNGRGVTVTPRIHGVALN